MTGLVDAVGRRMPFAWFDCGSLTSVADLPGRVITRRRIQPDCGPDRPRRVRLLEILACSARTLRPLIPS